MPDADYIKVTVTERAGAAILAPAGEIGYQEAPAFRSYIRHAYDKRPTRLIADLTAVEYMSTPGLATLVEALQLSKKLGIPLVLCGLNQRVRAIFEIARLHTVFKITPTLDSALTA